MDCLRATETLSAAHDGEPTAAEDLARAREHCDACASCAAFASALTRLDAVPGPRASEELVARLTALGAQTAAEIAEHASGATAQTPPGMSGAPGTAAPRVPRVVPGWWTPRFTIMATAAAMVFLAVAIGAAGLSALLGPQAAPADDIALLESTGAPGPDAADGYGDATTSDDGALSAAAPDDAARSSAPAPEYLTLENGVWALETPGDPLPSDATTAGVVTSALADSGEATKRTAFISADGLALWVADDGGAYARFARVTRTLGMRRYGLVSGSQLAYFGQWPMLPERFAAPTAPDGSPTFRYFGFDDLSRDIYVPVGASPDTGFALPPNMPPDDPAASNPYWTWWEPL